MRSSEILQWATALGFGTGLAAVITAIIAARSSKGKSRAEAADILIGAAERVGKLNEAQFAEITDLKFKLELTHVLMIDYLGEQISREELLKAMRELR